MNKWQIIALFVLLVWVVVAQSCMKFNISDKDALASFHKDGLSLQLQTLQTEKTAIHYAMIGADTLPTLCFVHGSPGSWNAFMQYMKDKDLLQQYRIVSIDRSGYGYSNFGKGRNMATNVAAIGEVMKAIRNGKPLYIAGHSLGGPLAVALAAAYSKEVTGIVLLAASVDPNEETKELWRPVMKLPPFRWLMPGAFRPSNDELWYFKKDVLAMPQCLQSLRCKVTIIHGVKDDLVPIGNAYYAQKMMVNAAGIQLIKLDDANHFIPWTRYEVIKKALLNL